VAVVGGMICQVIQLYVSIKRRSELRDETGDPWDGRNMEWATSSPPPAFNFAVLPNVKGEEAYWAIKQRAREQARLRGEPDYEPVEMPRNSPTGFVCAFFATLMGFALIWHIWWMAALGVLGAWATFVVFAWRDVPDYIIPAAEVARIDRANREARLQGLAAYVGPRP
jgi:cytochrome o ubiquinol oxidase subunit I